MSALWNVAFDDIGNPQFSSALSKLARAELSWQTLLPLTDNQRKRLAVQRENIFKDK